MSKYLRIVEANFTVKTPEIPEVAVLTVVDMFNFYLSQKKISTGGVGKIIVQFDAPDTKEEFSDMDDVCVLRKPFTAFDRIRQADNLTEKRKRFIEEFVAALKDIFNGSYSGQPEKWDTAPLDETLLLLHNKHYQFEEYWKKNKWNPSRTLQAKIFWTWTDHIELFFHILDKSNQLVHRKLILVTGPGIGALESNLGDITWQDNATVQLLHSNKRDYWTYNTETDTLEFHYPRAEKGDAHGQYDLGIMYLEGKGVLMDREKGKYWLQKAAAQQFSKATKKLAEL